MRRGAMLALVVCTALVGVASAGGSAPGADRSAASRGPEFQGGVERLGAELRERMKGSSWHEGCPLGLSRLRLVRASHWDFRGGPAKGVLVVHERYAAGALDVMERLFAKRFPIRRMELVDRYGADDRRSMAHDNTSAFNCRFVSGTTRWSMHAYGKAIDVNPRENPYVSGDFVSPPEGRPYADRKPRREGMIFRRGPVTGAFERIIGWEWAGTSRAGRGFRDYQHLSADGT